MLSFQNKQFSRIFPIAVYSRKDWNTEGKALDFTQSYICKMRSLEADIWVSSVARWAYRSISSSMSQYHHIMHIFRGKYLYTFFSFIFAYDQIQFYLFFFFIYIHICNEFFLYLNMQILEIIYMKVHCSFLKIIGTSFLKLKF